VDVVDGTDAAGNLSAGGRAAVVKAGLGAVSDSAVSDGSLLALDQSIGQTLAGDAFLENLPKGGLTTILQNAIAGIYGASGRAQAVAPEAAEAFVQGLLATGVPDGAVPPPFAVAILKNVAKNTNVDELVAYEVGLRDNASSTNLVTLATTLFKAYPAAIVKLAQGITAVTTPGFNNEAERIDYIRDLVAAQAGDAIPVVQGAVFVDPYYAGPFTQGVFTSILTAPKGAKLLVADAPGIAGGVGSVLGQDGSGLTEVAEVFGQFISAGDLPAASAAAYATALIGGAVRSNVPAFTGVAAGGGGGQLNLGAGITAATVTDLAAITDLLANGILTADHASLTGTGLAKAASQVEALAAAAARFTRNEIFDNGNGTSGAVAAFIAGSLADDVAALNLGDNGPASPQQVLFAAIDKAVTAVTNQAVDPAVNAVFKGQDYLNYPVLGAISGPETAVTNL
jgi:hypothetical protein